MANFVEQLGNATPQGSIKSPIIDQSSEVLAKGLTDVAQDYLKTSGGGSTGTKDDAYGDILGQATGEFAELNESLASGNLDRTTAAYHADRLFYHYAQFVPQKSEYFANMRDGIVSGKTKEVIYADAIAMEKGKSSAIENIEKQKYETAYQLGVEGYPTYRSPDGQIDADRTLRNTMRQQQQFEDTKRLVDLYQNDTALQQESIKQSYYNPVVADAFEKEFAWALTATAAQIQQSDNIAEGKKPYLLAINNVKQARSQGKQPSPQDLAMVNNYGVYATQQLKSQFVRNGIRPDLLPQEEGGVHEFVDSTIKSFIGEVSPEGTVKFATWQDTLATMTDKAEVRKMSPVLTRLSNVFGDNMMNTLLTQAENKGISSYLSERDKVFNLFTVETTEQGTKIVPNDAVVDAVSQAGSEILPATAPKADIDKVGSGGLLAIRSARDTNNFLANGKVAGAFLNASANLANAAAIGSNIKGQGIDQLIKEFNDPVTQAQINDSANMAPEQFKQFGEAYGTKLEQEIAARKLMIENRLEQDGFSDTVDIVFYKNGNGGYTYSLNVADSVKPGKKGSFNLPNDIVTNLQVLNRATVEHQKLSKKGAIPGLETIETISSKAKGNLEIYDRPETAAFEGLNLFQSAKEQKLIAKPSERIKATDSKPTKKDQKRLEEYNTKKDKVMDEAVTDAYDITASHYIKEPMGGKGVGELKQEFVKRWKAAPSKSPADIYVQMQIDLTGDEVYLPVPPKPELAGQPIQTPQPSPEALEKLKLGQ